MICTNVCMIHCVIRVRLWCSHMYAYVQRIRFVSVCMCARGSSLVKRNRYERSKENRVGSLLTKMLCYYARIKIELKCKWETWLPS